MEKSIKGASKGGTKSADSNRPNVAAVTIPPIVDLSDEELDELSPEEFIAGQKELLASEREILLDQAANLKAEADRLAMDAEPGEVQFDEESGEGGTTTIDRERDLALAAQARAGVEEIDEAFRRINMGNYGVCENCKNPIPRARLRALPYAKLCVRCKAGGLSALR